jgi:hypothetical protein
LEFISCSPRISRNVADATLSAYISWGTKTYTSGELRAHIPESSEAGDMIGNLLHTGLDNRSTIAETIERSLCGRVKGPDATAAALAAETALTLTAIHIHRSSDVSETSQELMNYWLSIQHAIFQSTRDQMMKLARDYVFVARAMHFVGKLPLKDLVAVHGASPIFKRAASSTERDFWSPVGQAPLYHVIMAPESATLSRMLDNEIPELERIGALLLQSRPPWTGTPDFAGLFFDWTPETSRFRTHGSPTPKDATTLPTDALFGAAILAATSIEAIEGTKQLPAVLSGISSGCRFGLLSKLQRLLLSRISEQNPHDTEAELTAGEFAPAQSDMLRRWAKHEVNFVRHHGKKLRA